MPNPNLSLDSNEGDPPGEWNRTVRGADLARELQEQRKAQRFFDEPDTESKYGYFVGRPIIGHDTRVNGGVYIGGGEREAIVVDDQKDQDIYDQIYQVVIDRARQRMADEGLDFKTGILDDVYDTVRETLQYDGVYANDLARKYLNQKINLSVMIGDGKGVCRHQALLTAYLLERLGSEGRIGGQVSVQRNAIPGVGAHAWARYINARGETYVIDPTQGYIGNLDDAPSDGWIYRRPEDA